MSARVAVPLAVLSALLLCGCAGPHLAAGEDVRVIHSQRLHDDADARDLPPEVPDAEFVTAFDLVHGAFVSVESAARDFAAHNDANVVLIRPSVPQHTMRRTRIEAWRTKGFRLAAAEDAAERGRTLLPPADTPISQRDRHILDCFTEARADPLAELPESEKPLLEGNDTRGFIVRGQPLIDRHERPTKSGLTYRRVPNPGGASSDIYVACLLKRGYRWPPP